MKKRLLLGAALLVVLVAIFGVLALPTTKRTIPSNAIGVRYKDSSMGWVSLTNTTSRQLVVHFRSVQLRTNNQWTDIPPVSSKSAPAFCMIPAHSAVVQTIDSAPIGEPWRLKMLVVEQLTGSDRFMRATRYYLQKQYDRVRGKPARFGYKGSVFSTNVTYYGHETELLSLVPD